jgi:hypothetical protein
MKGRVAVLLMMTASVAAAEPPRTTQLEASGACPLPDVDAHASELLGRAAIDASAAARVRVVTEQHGDALDATLVFVDENGSAQPARPITAASCAELAESVAIVISLVLREAPPTPAAPSRASASAPTAAERVRDSTTLATVRPPTTTAFELGAATRVGGGPALVLGVRLERGRRALGFDVAIDAPATADVPPGSVHILAARADAVGCLHARGFAACGLVAGGVARARGEDLMDARAAIRPLVAVGVRAEWRRLVTRHLGVRGFASVEQLLVRPSFLVADTAVWTSPLVQAWVGFGAFFQMP